MTKNKLFAASNEVARHLANLGCPLDTLRVVDDGYESTRRRLIIEQQDSILENQIFETIHGGTGLRISLRIGYGARRKMTISDWQFDLPGMKSQPIWLEDPLEQLPAMDLYRIPGAKHEEYTRDIVINHHRVLKDGDVVEGFLLGFWMECLPDIYTHGISVNATLVLLDEIGRDYRTEVSLLVDRKSERSRPRSLRPKRQSLFETRDCVKAPASRR